MLAKLKVTCSCMGFEINNKEGSFCLLVISTGTGLFAGRLTPLASGLEKMLLHALCELLLVTQILAHVLNKRQILQMKTTHR